MASREAIAGTLKFMHELYPQREITKTTAEAWSLAFAEWEDDELQSAAMAAATTPGRTFFPTPGEIAAQRKTSTPVVDAANLLRQIEKLGTPHPALGWLPPHVGTVRDALGDVIADAYAAAGGAPRVFSDDATTRAVAYREFQKRGEEFAQIPADQRPQLLPGIDRRRIAGGKPEGIASVVQRALPTPEPSA